MPDDQIDPKEFERVKEDLRMLLGEAVELIRLAYYEIEHSGNARVVVDEGQFTEFVATVDNILRDKGESTTQECPVKRMPNFAMRDALEWILQPDHAIGSYAEMVRKTEELVRKALRA